MVAAEKKRESSLPPVGSSCAGNISWPQILHAATAVTMPVKANVVKKMIMIMVMVMLRDVGVYFIPRKEFCILC